MKNKIILSILIMLVVISASLGSGLTVKNKLIDEKNEYNMSTFDICDTEEHVNDTDVAPYTINFIPIDKQHDFKNNEETQSFNYVTNSPTFEKGKVSIIDDNNICSYNYSNNFKKLENEAFENIDSPIFDEYFAAREYYKANRSENNFKFNGSLEKVPIPMDNTRSVLSPPWDDCGHGTQATSFLAFHEEHSSVNCNTGQGYNALAGSCGFAQWVISHSWAWCVGYFDCTQSDYYHVNFVIDYNGFVQCFDFPIGYGLAKLEIEANVAFQLANESVGTNLIFYADSWPYVGNYPIPDPYSPPGPYQIGYPSPVFLQAGYRYNFTVQFNVYLDCAAFGFTVSAGAIELNNWFLSANFDSQTPPLNIDLVSQGMVEINDEWYYAIWPDPFYFSPGSTVDLYAYIWNDGTDPANGFYVAIGVDEEDYYGGPFSCPPGGVTNGVGFVLQDFVWPNDLETHYIWCWVDIFDDIIETNEDNNFGVIAWNAVGPPNIEVTDITLIKYNANTWPPDPEDIDWVNPDPFNVGDRVIPFSLISNNGDGPSFDLAVKYYEDNILMAEGTFTLGPDSWFICYVEDGSGNPGFIWNSQDCMDIRWDVHDYNYGQYDSKEETYCPITPQYTVTFETDPVNGGTITFNGVVYSHGQSTLVSGGTYNIVANPATNYQFSHWTSTCGTVANPNAASTTVTVSATGTLKAHFNYIPPQYTVTFQTDPTNGGTITFNGVTYSHGQSTLVSGGTYNIVANPATNYQFSQWTSTCGTVANQYAQETTVTVSATGTLKAYFTSTNQPPEAPTINGPTNGNAGTTYSYTFITTDPDGDKVYYFIDWGDGSFDNWFGPYDSGEMISKSHTWDETGTYTIKAKAKDIHGAESPWGTLTVTMPVNQESSHSISSQQALLLFQLRQIFTNRFVFPR